MRIPCRSDRVSPFDVPSRRSRAAWLAGASLGLAAATAGAQSLSFTPLHPDQVGAAGATFEFFGTVRNDSGQALQTSDLFFDFSGFDPDFLAPTQLLGDVVTTLASGATSAPLALFEVALAPGATPGSTFGSDVVLQDTVGDLSDPVTVTVSVVPEPSTALLLLFGLATLGGRAFRGRRNASDTAEISS